MTVVLLIILKMLTQKIHSVVITNLKVKSKDCLYFLRHSRRLIVVQPLEKILGDFFFFFLLCGSLVDFVTRRRRKEAEVPGRAVTGQLM